jgi:hypothetical protein
MTLTELYNSKGYDYYPTDKDTKHTYLNFYEVLFNKYKNKKINLFEVGIKYGGSIRLWEDYFPDANIFACDIKEISECVPLIRTVKFIESIRKMDFSVFNKNPLDIAIDDGSHLLADQIFFVESVYPKMKEGGLLIIEDVKRIDETKKEFKRIGVSFYVIDARHTGRHDNVLLLFIKK